MAVERGAERVVVELSLWAVFGAGVLVGWLTAPVASRRWLKLRRRAAIWLAGLAKRVDPDRYTTGRE